MEGSFKIVFAIACYTKGLGGRANIINNLKRCYSDISSDGDIVINNIVQTIADDGDLESVEDCAEFIGHVIATLGHWLEIGYCDTNPFWAS